MQKFNLNDKKNTYPGFYNIYPIENEISIHSDINNINPLNEEYFLDDYYGRILNSSVRSPYGKDESMNYSIKQFQSKIIDTLRVPFRKVPIFDLENLTEIQQLIDKLSIENPSQTILLRGQLSSYFVSREKEEIEFLYGNECTKEPSFQPSFLRSDFDQTFIYSLWHSQTAILLNDIGMDLSKSLTPSQIQDYYQDVMKIKGSADFTPISLGIAQHYGLPSIGLDLTKDLKVALWFATNKLNVNNEGIATTHPATDLSSSTLYIFRCPNNTVFSYKMIKPKYISNTRPDRQDAWFSHVGWGAAKNQLATYLICGIRLKSDVLNIFTPNYPKFLFPTREEDFILNNFLNIVDNEKYTGEVRRALNRIYKLEDH